MKPSIDKPLDKNAFKIFIGYLHLTEINSWIGHGAEPTQNLRPVKPTLQALEEIGNWKCDYSPRSESKHRVARLKVIQARLAAEEEERKIKEQIAKEKEEGDKI